MGYGILALFAIGVIWLASESLEQGKKDNILDHYDHKNQP